MKISKQYKQYVFVLSMFILASCKKTTTVVQAAVPINITQISFTIPPNQTSTDTTINVYYNIDSAIRIATNGSYNVTDIKLVTPVAANAILTGATDVADNFNNIDSLSVAITSSSDTTSAIFAQFNSVNNATVYSTTSLNIPVNNGVELKNYFDATSFNFIFRSTLSPTTIPLTVVATIQFNVEVGPN